MAIVGASGQLGGELAGVLVESGIVTLPLGHEECDVTNPERMLTVLQGLRPDAIINCAAYVRVDDAEEEPSTVFAVNAIGAQALARAAEALQARCVYISSDYVFNGSKADPYTEEDATDPINVYGVSKLAGEYLTRLTATRHLVIRVAGLFGGRGSRGKAAGNFVQAILRRATAGEPLRVVDDTRISVTYTRHAALAIAQLLQDEASGIVHVTNAGATTWYDVAVRTLATAGLASPVERITNESLRQRARRPRQSVLVSKREGQHTAFLASWEAALDEYLRDQLYSIPVSS